MSTEGTAAAGGPGGGGQGSLRRLVACLSVAVLALAACSAGGGAPGPEETGAAGDGEVAGGGEEVVLRVGASDAFTIGNPFNQVSLTDARMRSYIHPFLVSYSPEGELIGSFAQDWTVSDDGLTYTFDTVEDARWSDGEPLTARDAAYTIDMVLRYRDGATARRAGQVAGITSVEAPDDDTLVLTYEEVNVSALDLLSQLPILAEHVWSEIEGDDGEGLAAFTNTDPMVSGGPFVLRDFREEVSVFEVNEHWYGPQPGFDVLAVTLFSNPDAMVGALRDGDVDMIVGVPPTAVESVRALDGVVVTEVAGSQYQYMYPNLDRDDKPYLLDPAFRRAVGHAIDRDAIAGNVFDGTLAPNPSSIGPYTPDWHNPDVEQPFDLDLADQILTEAGYTLDDSGRRLADGEPISFEIFTVTTNDGGARTYEAIARTLAELGIETTTRVLDPAGANDYENFDAGIFNGSSTMDPSRELRIFTCPPDSGFNPTSFCDPSYDELFEQQATELDAGARREIVHEMQRWLVEEQSVLWVLGYQNGYVIHRAEWSGFEGYPDAAFSFWAPFGLLSGHRTG